jgi:phage tail protein X
MRFAEFHFLLPQLGGAGGDENMALVFLKLGTLVGGNRVFQRQRVQTERIAQAGDGLAVWRPGLDPDEAIRLPDMLTDIVERDSQGVSAKKERAVDRSLLFSNRHRS